MSGTQGNHTFHSLINLVLWSILVSYLGLLFVFGWDGEQVQTSSFQNWRFNEWALSYFAPVITLLQKYHHRRFCGEDENFASEGWPQILIFAEKWVLHSHATNWHPVACLKTQSISEKLCNMYKIEDRSRQNLSHFSCVLMCTGLKCPVRTCNSATML